MRRFVPTPSMVVAAIAVVIATSGSATAATLITGKQIKNGSITGADVRKGSLTGKHVKNRSLAAKDLKPGALGARAYATMRPDECFPPGFTCTIYRTKNVKEIRREGTGVYCVVPKAGLSFAGVTPSFSTDSYNSGPDNGQGVPIVAYSSLGGVCAARELEVRTFRATGAGPTVAASNSTSFGVVIP